MQTIGSSACGALRRSAGTCIAKVNVPGYGPDVAANRGEARKLMVVGSVAAGWSCCATAALLCPPPLGPGSTPSTERATIHGRDHLDLDHRLGLSEAADLDRRAGRTAHSEIPHAHVRALRERR